MAGKKILVVDPDTTFLKTVVEPALSPHGFQLLLTGDQDRAVEIAAVEDPCLLLLRFPMESTLQLLRRLAQQEQQIPSVLIVGQEGEPVPLELMFINEIKAIEEVTGKDYDEDNNKSLMRIISDHIKSATFLIDAQVLPSNKEKGYILRKFLRRSAIKMRKLKGEFKPEDFSPIAEAVIKTYDGLYLDKNKTSGIVSVIMEEIGKFNSTLERGLKEIEKIQKIDAHESF